MVDLAGAAEGLAALREAAEVDCREPDRRLLLEIIGQYDAFWGHVELKIDAEMLSRAERLKVINTASTGTDHIDVREAERRGIRVLSITRDDDLLEGFTATAELAWTLILACHRHFHPALHAVLEGRWDQRPFCGRQLSGQTLGVLGVGRLGRMVCAYGKAFRMRVLGCDLKPFAIPGVEPADFEDLLRRSDTVSIHIHMTPDNYHLFGGRAFEMMRDGAVLVNTSRGDIIDEAALLRALENGKLAAFGADVLHDEWRADMSESPLIQYARRHDNVLITPHIGGNTDTSLWGARIHSARKLARWLRG